MSDLLSECSDISYLSDLDFEWNSINFDYSNGSPLDKENFKVIHYNINSILAPDRLEQLSDICQLLHINVLILTESKLDQTIPNNLITLPGYHEPLRRDREINGRHGGGVLVYIADNLVFKQKQELQSQNFEHIWVDVKLKNKLFAINALYRPPNQSAADHELFLTTAEYLLDNLKDYTSTNKIIASDLNFGNCYCKNPVLSPKPLDSTAPGLFSSYGFTQLIDLPTRVTDTTIALIDLIFVDNLDDIVCHGTLPKIADHDGVVVCFNTKSDKQTSRTKTIYDYNNADMDGLINYIKEFDFEYHVFGHPTINQAELYSNFLSDAFSKFVPCKTVVIRPTDPAWSNTFTRRLLRKKNRNYLFYKKCMIDHNNAINQQNIRPEIVTRLLNKTNKALKKSRDAANESTKVNRRAKAAFYNTINSTMNNHSISAKKKFSILIKLMKNNKFSSIPPLVENDETIQDPLQKSNIFNTFFASKSTVNNFDDPAPHLDRKEDIPALDCLNTSPIEISKFIRNIKKSYASHCGISGKFIHLIAQPICYSMSKLFNNLFEIGHFPDIWKIAHITPVYKRSGPKTSKTSFRPISILPTMSKIFESVIHDRLMKHCMENNVISEKQAAYLKGDSTVLQLLYIVHTIRVNWGHSKITQGVFLDISAAFDKM